MARLTINHIKKLEEDVGLSVEEMTTLLKAGKNGFYDNISSNWQRNEFIVDYDFFKQDFCLRSIRVNGALGSTKFYLKDYKKTWWLRKDKSE